MQSRMQMFACRLLARQEPFNVQEGMAAYSAGGTW